jgi:hypothetical protein
VGRDAILGLGSTTYLSQELLTVLHRQHIYYLFQAKGSTDQGSLSTQWKDCSDLGLSGNLALEWQRYCRALLGAGIQLRDQDDELLWNGGDSSGNISVKNLYEAIASTIWNQKCTGWRKQLWHWNIPLKIKLFTWLAATNKILTWDNLQHRGWEGPNIFHLCRLDSESVTHLFIDCTFTQQVWSRLFIALKLRTTWTGSSLKNCLEDWTKEESLYPHLPALVSWHIWLVRNKTIFDQLPPSTNVIYYKTLGGLEGNKTTKDPTPRFLQPTYLQGRTTAWFDGASQNFGHQCGAGGLIKLQTTP